MLLIGSELKGYAIEAQDGRIGTVSDFLFDDRTWKFRWLVVDTGKWLSGRKVLIHPSAIGPSDAVRHELRLALTKQQIDDSPDIFQDQPVSRQMESSLHDYYGWEPYWGTNYFGSGAIASPLASPPYFGLAEKYDINDPDADTGHDADKDAGDPHLRSIAAVTGYHVLASNGDIGHIKDFLIDDANWDIHYLIIDTRNWWPGKQVLVSPYAVRDIDWSDRHVELNVSRDQVKTSPAWSPTEMVGQEYEKILHSHYHWPGYGW